jgi:hypothetical protein
LVDRRHWDLDWDRHHRSDHEMDLLEDHRHWALWMDP